MTDDGSQSRQGMLPDVRRATFADLRFVLQQGWSDFRTEPAYGIFFGAVYALGGLILIGAVTVWRLHWIAYPLVIGFALIGPFIATGLYEVSRRLETGAALSWRGILGVVWDQHRRELGWMAFVMLFVFWVWMYQARTLFAVFFGSRGFATFEGFIEAILTTANGWTFLAVGHLVGAIISLVLFSVTVVACPLLLDREVDFITAMITSIRSVLASPVVMIAWGLFVIVSVILSALPAFLGLLVVLPVLGHATWHLYRRIVIIGDLPPADSSS
ncbi:MAG: DUF2189 domain-containing protein [Hyphomicrobiaceae bacterium]